MFSSSRNSDRVLHVSPFPLVFSSVFFNVIHLRVSPSSFSLVSSQFHTPTSTTLFFLPLLFSINIFLEFFSPSVFVHLHSGTPILRPRLHLRYNRCVSVRQLINQSIDQSIIPLEGVPDTCYHSHHGKTEMAISFIARRSRSGGNFCDSEFTETSRRPEPGEKGEHHQ